MKNHFLVEETTLIATSIDLMALHSHLLRLHPFQNDEAPRCNGSDWPGFDRAWCKGWAGAEHWKRLNC